MIPGVCYFIEDTDHWSSVGYGIGSYCANRNVGELVVIDACDADTPWKDRASYPVAIAASNASVCTAIDER